MSKWIKIAQQDDMEFYHGTTTGNNNQTLKAFIANGIDPKASSGLGQGAGFFMQKNFDASKNHAVGLEGMSGFPMVIKLKMNLDPKVFDFDYEVIPKAAYMIVNKLWPLFKSLSDDEIVFDQMAPFEYTHFGVSPNPNKNLRIRPSLSEIYQHPRIPDRKGLDIHLEGDHENKGLVTSKQELRPNKEGNAFEAEIYGQICKKLEEKFPEEFYEAEREILGKIKNPEKLVIKYDGNYKINIDPREDVIVLVDGKWIDGASFLSMNLPTEKAPVEEEKKLNSSSAQTIETKSATPPPSVAQLKNYIISQCKGDAYEIFLWSEGKSEVNNPPVEIRNIVMSMNPKITGLNHYIFDNVDAVNYFKAWIPMKTLGDEAFEYILNNNEEYLNLYRSWGRPNQIQNVEMHAKDENLENDPDIDRLRLKAKEEMNKPSMLKQSSKAIRKIRF
jgi:hypothetical protein